MKYAVILASLVAAVAAQDTTGLPEGAAKCVDDCLTSLGDKVTCKVGDQACICRDQDTQAQLGVCITGKPECAEVIAPLLEYQKKACPALLAGGSSTSASDAAGATPKDAASKVDSAVSAATSAASDASSAATKATSIASSVASSASGAAGAAATPAGNATTGGKTNGTSTGASPSVSSQTGAAGKLVAGSAFGVVAFVAALLL